MRLRFIYSIIIICLLTLGGCDNNSNEILTDVFPNYSAYDFNTKYFTSNMWVQPHVILYRGRMNENEYREVLSNPSYIKNCNEFGGYYENMQEHRYPFNLLEVDWWSPIYNDNSDFVGHYDYELRKFTDCETSRQYRYAFSYKDGYCYLIIENTLSKDLNEEEDPSAK